MFLEVENAVINTWVSTPLAIISHFTYTFYKNRHNFFAIPRTFTIFGHNVGIYADYELELKSENGQNVHIRLCLYTLV